MFSELFSLLLIVAVFGLPTFVFGSLLFVFVGQMATGAHPMATDASRKSSKTSKATKLCAFIGGILLAPNLLVPIYNLINAFGLPITSIHKHMLFDPASVLGLAFLAIALLMSVGISVNKPTTSKH